MTMFHLPIHGSLVIPSKSAFGSIKEIYEEKGKKLENRVSGIGVSVMAKMLKGFDSRKLFATVLLFQVNSFLANRTGRYPS